MKDNKIKNLINAKEFKSIVDLKNFLKEYRKLEDAEKREAFVRIYYNGESWDDAVYKATQETIIIGDKDALIEYYVEDYFISLLGEVFDKVGFYLDYEKFIRDLELGGDVCKIDDPDFEYGEIYYWNY